MPDFLMPIVIMLLAVCIIWHYYSWNKLHEVLKNNKLPCSSMFNPMGLNNDLHTIIDLINETDSVDEKKSFRSIKNKAQLSFLSPFLVMLTIGIVTVVIY